MKAEKKNGIPEQPHPHKGGFILLFLVILLLLQGVNLYFSGKKIKYLSCLLKDKISKRAEVETREKKIFFATSVLSELKGWQTLPPPSDIKELEQIPPGLILKEYSLTRHLFVSVLNEKKSSERLPKPIRAIHFLDFISIDIDEEKKGSGVHIFPQLKTSLETMCSCKLKSSREFSSIEEEKNPTEKASWVISGKKPSLPLWKKSIK
jgi:hypothetical protein